MAALNKFPDTPAPEYAGGFFPSGEGAGYAGGNLSAAVDGIKVAEVVALSMQKTVTPI